MNKNHKKKILVLVDWFDPGFLAGGPIRSCVNFVENMAEKYDVFVYTSAFDLGEKKPYPDILTNQWVTYGEGYVSKVYYSLPGIRSIFNLYKVIRSLNPDFVYLNSMFSFRLTQIPLLIMLITAYKGKIILAPRGMLHEGALKIKTRKKKLFLSAFKWSGISKRIHFQATNTSEKNEINKFFPNHASVTVISNFPSNRQSPWKKISKNQGSVNCIIVSRVIENKNILFFLEVLSDAPADINLNIYGPVENAGYWEKCKEQIARLPENVSVNYHGELQPSQVSEKLKQNHIFVSPTMGENFGHSIFEALLAGKPVMISDKTPWQNLEAKKAGWVIPLNKPEKFLKHLEEAAAMEQQEYDQWSKASWNYAGEFLKNSNPLTNYHNLFS